MVNRAVSYCFSTSLKISFSCHIRTSRLEEEEEYENVVFCGIVKGNRNTRNMVRSH